MNEFKHLFGVENTEIHETCILVPFLPKGFLKELGIPSLSKGKLYSSGGTATFSLIVTGVGAPQLGDAVLYLKDTLCKQLILTGACGLLTESPSLKIGSLVCPEKCFGFESFSQLLENKAHDNNETYPTKEFLESFLKNNKNIMRVTCATMGSLKLEQDYREALHKKNISIVDMECSSFFKAAQHIGRPALAVFFVTDIVSKKPFYLPQNQEDRSAITSAISHTAGTLKSFLVNRN